MNGQAPIGVLLVTHGRLGEELLEAARTIVGDIQHMSFLSIGWNDEVEASRTKIAESVRSVDSGRGVIILTDMFGGTPSNLSLPLLRKDHVEIVTGVNLPMVIKLANQGAEESLAELARKVRDQGQRHISIASELLGE
ncbi:MAG: PTS fructose transporter subunit IIA [Acidobacteriota bacterium]|jgi:PTS system mannose-specific IIA component